MCLGFVSRKNKNKPTKAGLAIAGIGIIVFTLAEDFATGGAGIADDPVTISTGIGMIMQAFA